MRRRPLLAVAAVLVLALFVFRRCDIPERRSEANPSPVEEPSTGAAPVPTPPGFSPAFG